MYVPLPLPSPLPSLPLSAPAESGTTSVSATRAAIAKRRPSRPPDPQRAFLRDSPRDPLPQRALERTPRFQPVDSRIVCVPPTALQRGPQFPQCRGLPRPSERRVAPAAVPPPVGGDAVFPHSRERGLT